MVLSNDPHGESRQGRMPIKPLEARLAGSKILEAADMAFVLALGMPTEKFNSIDNLKTVVPNWVTGLNDGKTPSEMAAIYPLIQDSIKRITTTLLGFTMEAIADTLFQRTLDLTALKTYWNNLYTFICEQHVWSFLSTDSGLLNTARNVLAQKPRWDEHDIEALPEGMRKLETVRSHQ